jgi:hypothetical protein
MCRPAAACVSWRLPFSTFPSNHPEYLDLIMVYESRYFVYHDRETSANPDSHLDRCQQVSDEMARMVTKAIEAGMAGGGLKSDLAPRQLMLILWGQIFGVMKIFRMRRHHFKAAFGISRKDLFSHFVEMVERSLTP